MPFGAAYGNHLRRLRWITLGLERRLNARLVQNQLKVPCLAAPVSAGTIMTALVRRYIHPCTGQMAACFFIQPR